MSSTFPLANLNERIYRVNAAFYQQIGEMGMLPKPSELIRGVIVKKMSKSPLHGILARLIFQRLLALAPPTHSVRFDEPLALTDSVPEPDIAIVAGHNREYLQQHPTTAVLVIEVAVSSLREDREMVAVYAEAGVQEYWIVQPRQKQVEVYRHPENSQYLSKHISKAGEAVQSSVLPEICLVLAELLAEAEA